MSIEPSCALSAPHDESNPELMESLSAVREAVTNHFPYLWPAVEVGLSTCATLLLKDAVNCTAVIFVGASGVGKSTTAEMFTDIKVNGKPLSYVSDNFTPSAFVSHAAKVKASELAKIDLLPRIQHKLLVTPELAPIFRGKPTDLIPRFSVITRVLDGQGLQTDSGTHGQRGYRGDYMFAWLGCTTPFDDAAWEVMAQLGSRLFFLFVDTGTTVSEQDLLRSINGESPYSAALQECKRLIGVHVQRVFEAWGDVRGVIWDGTTNSPSVMQWIVRFARLLAQTRGIRSTADGVVPLPESPHRANAVLYNLARGHALIHGRTMVVQEDLPCLAKVTLSSIPTERGRVLRAFIRANHHTLTLAHAQAALGVKSLATARHVMEDLVRLGVLEQKKGAQGKADVFCVHCAWAWCVSNEFRAMVGE